MSEVVHGMLDGLYLRDRGRYREIAQAIMGSYRYRCLCCPPHFATFESREERGRHMREGHRSLLEAFQLNIGALVLGSQELGLMIPRLERAIQRVRVAGKVFESPASIQEDLLRNLYSGCQEAASSLVHTLIHPGMPEECFSRTPSTHEMQELERILQSHRVLYNDLESVLVHSIKALEEPQETAHQLNLSLADSTITNLRNALSEITVVIAERRKNLRDDFVLIGNHGV